MRATVTGAGRIWVVEGFVRRFAGRVVRGDRAAGAVVPMPETGDRAPVPLDPTAYDAPAPAVYRYRHATPDGEAAHTGLVLDMAVAAFADGRVRGHEDVQPARVTALVEHLATGPERVELVATLHRPGPRYAAAMTTDSGDPVVDVVTEDGHRHTVWRLPDDPALLAELDAAQHYVADGHHRVAAARTLWERAGRPDDHALTTVVHAADDLDLVAFHRLLEGPVDPADLVDRMSTDYDVTTSDGSPDVEPWDVRVRVDGRWYLARRRGGHPDVLPLGVALLEATLAPTVLEPLRAKVRKLRAQADATGAAAFVLVPPPLDDVLALADRGLTVPAKTTYFRPKPASGLFVR